MAERQDSLDLLLSCVVCLEEFEEDGDKIPRLLPCTHTLCETCVKQLIRNHKLECPECRAKHEAYNEEKSFPQNKYLLMQIRKRSVRNLEEKVPRGYERCKDHGKELSLFCQEPGCQRAICQRCLTKHHKKHYVVELEEEIKENVIVEVEQTRKNLESKMRLISRVKEDIDRRTEESVKELMKTQETINTLFEDMVKKIKETQKESNVQLDDELSALNINVMLLENINQHIEHKEDITYDEIISIQETVKEIHKNNAKHFSGTRNVSYAKISSVPANENYLMKSLIRSLKENIRKEDINFDLMEDANDEAPVSATSIRCSVKWTRNLATRSNAFLTLLSNNRVVSLDQCPGKHIIKFYDLGTGTEQVSAEQCISSDRQVIGEVRLAGRLSFVVYHRHDQSIEFRDPENLSQIIYIHSVAPHYPEDFWMTASSGLLYNDGSEIHWLDCSEGKPKLLKEKSFTTSLGGLSDLVVVLNGADELIIGSYGLNDIHCYNTTTKSMEWKVTGYLPGMQKRINPLGITADERGHLFVVDWREGNGCIQMFSVSDGQYLGCLIKEGEQGLGSLNMIRWHSASQSLVVLHDTDNWCLSMINVKF